MTAIEDKVFNFGNQKHAADFVKNCEELTKCIAVNYKHGGTKMAMATKKMEKPKIIVPEVPKDTASRVEIFICDKSTKKMRGRRQPPKKTERQLPA